VKQHYNPSIVNNNNNNIHVEKSGIFLIFQKQIYSSTGYPYDSGSSLYDTVGYLRSKTDRLLPV